MGRYGNEIIEAGMVGAFEPLVYIPGRFGMQNKDMFCGDGKRLRVAFGCDADGYFVESGLMIRLADLNMGLAARRALARAEREFRISDENYKNRNYSDSAANPARAPVGEPDDADRRLRDYQALY